jgi:hypothetical protein
MTIPTDVRAAARELLFAMELGAHGPELQAKTTALRVALGDPHHARPGSPKAAATCILLACAKAGITEQWVVSAMLRASIADLWPAVRALDGKLTMAMFQQQEGGAGAALLYIVVLLLARAEQDVLVVH